MKRTAGFTLIELLLTTLIFVFAILGATQMFTGLLNQYKQESKIVETSVEGIVGLDLFRRDIESAGYGLPWKDLATYQEIDVGKDAYAAGFNDATTSAPRAIVSGDNTADARYAPGTDYLVIKSISVAGSNISHKWTFLYNDDTTKVWGVAAEDLSPTDRVIVLEPVDSGKGSGTLSHLDPGPGFSTQFSNIADFTSSILTRVVYGVHDSVDLSMPFNRADYYVSAPGAPDVPTRCAPGTGILYKAVVSHTTNDLDTPTPLLDCVADMQVVFHLDTDKDGEVDNKSQDITALTADDVREQVRKVFVYILAQEGQYDGSYNHGTNSIFVGEAGPNLGRLYDLTAIPDGSHYRWKLYTLVVQPANLMWQIQVI